MIIRLAAVLADPTFDPNTSVNRIRALLILLLGVAMVFVSLISVIQAGRRGNNAKAFNIMSASMISLIPGAIGVGIGALAFGAAFLGWAVPGLSQ